MEFEVELGTYIRQRLRQLNITQQQAAARGGFTRQTLINWMKGDVQRIEITNIVSLARVLQVSPYFMLQYVCYSINIDIHSTASSTIPKDHSTFVEDVTIPDNTPVFVNATFLKQWQIQNTGPVTWTDRFFKCLDLDNLIEPSQPEITTGLLTPNTTTIEIPIVGPGETIVVEMEFRAPGLPGTVRSTWQMFDSTGTQCFPDHTGIWCQVRVVGV